MRTMMEGQEPRDEPVRDELPMDPYYVIARQYDDNVGRGLNYVGYSLEAIQHHLMVTPSAGAPTHYSYIPTWEERWAEYRGSMGVSGAGDQDDEDEQ